MMEYAIIPVESRAELCEFSGKFYEGEGFSMGQPIRWKNPMDAIPIASVASLMDYDKKPFEIIKFVFERYAKIDKVYADGLACGRTGWYERQDMINRGD